MFADDEPNIVDEDALEYMEIDLALTEVMASWENSLVNLNDEDRYLLMLHLRASYLKGLVDGGAKATAFYRPILTKMMSMLKRLGLDVLDPRAEAA